MLQIEQHARRGAGVALVDQHGAALQQVAVALQGEIDDSVEQRVARADEGGQRLALRRNQGLLEGDAFVARQHGFADTDEAVAVADRGRHMGDFVPPRFPLLGAAAEKLEGFVKERFDVVGLQTARVGAFHVRADTLDFACVHGVVGEHALFEQRLQVTAVERDIEHGGEERLDLRPFAVADRLDQQFAQGLALELDPAEHVEDLPPSAWRACSSFSSSLR